MEQVCEKVCVGFAGFGGKKQVDTSERKKD